MNDSSVELAEEAIDKEFANNGLMKIGYSQALWTLLSVLEDHNFKNTQVMRLSDEQLHVFGDTLLNAITHPVRAIYDANDQSPALLDKRLVNEHYALANEWLDRAIEYDAFCSIFSLWHKGKIQLSANGNVLETDGWRDNQYEYEMYNRLVKRDGGAEEDAVPSFPSSLSEKVMSCVKTEETSFKFTPSSILVREIVGHIEAALPRRHKLPDNWEISHFSFGEFRKVFAALEAILYGRSIARTIVASRGMVGLGFSSAIWIITSKKLVKKLMRFTGVRKASVAKIVDFLTFGSNEIRHPDVALQPLIDLKNGFLALSPFVFSNTNVERNFCVLVNQIPSERLLYSKLVQGKEEILRAEIVRYAKELGYHVAHGKLKNTDLDIAIIDRVQRACICFELKWFIEPAEIREGIQRSEELQKGVLQAKKILELHRHGDIGLIKRILEIDDEYTFTVAVGSRNWIGNHDVQDNDVPIIKIWHFLLKVRELNSLRDAILWLESRDYLPKKSIDFEVVPKDLSVGDWSSSWYGFRPLGKC